MPRTRLPGARLSLPDQLMSRSSHYRRRYNGSDPDGDMVRGLKCGEPESFRLLLRRYQNPVYGYVCRLIDDPFEAEDVTQDVFVKVFRKVEGFRGQCAFKTWLYRIAANESSNRRRWFSRHRARMVTERADDVSRDALAERMPDPSRGPFEQIERLEHRDILNRALSSLYPRYREAVVLRDVCGFTYNEIAETLEVSLGTVKSRILRGREGLKRYLLQSAPSVVPHDVRWQTE